MVFSKSNSGCSVLFTREEAAAYLGISPQTLAVWACKKRHAIPVVKIGRLCKYRKSDLDLFIESNIDSMEA